MAFSIGSVVQLQHLVKGSQYNGRIAAVKTDPNNVGRQNVYIFELEKTISIKSENMRLIMDSSGTADLLSGVLPEEMKNRNYNADNLGAGLINDIEKGSHSATEALLALKGRLSHFPHLLSFSYKESGIIDIVLKFLNRCEDETFSEVMSNLQYTSTCTGVGGDLKSPSKWIKILSDAFEGNELERSSMSKISQGIGPLVRCMVNDMERVFFKSTKHWKEGIEEFVHLIYNMISESITRTDKKLVDTLLNHDGLLRSIIQWSFWRDAAWQRPDIAQELNIEKRAQIIHMGGESIALLLNDAYQRIEQDGIERLAAIGSTQIVNKEYDPNCMTSYTAGLVRLIDPIDCNGDHLKNCLNIILVLVDKGDCVDKGVITEIIKFGFIYANRNDCHEGAECLAGILLSMLLQKPHIHYPSDARIAFAIRSGLIELCFTLVKCSGCAVGPTTKTFRKVYLIFSNIIAIGIHQKSAKAIRSKRRQIMEAVVCFEQYRDATNIYKCSTLLGFVKCTFDLNGRFCCHCNKSLGKTDAKVCNGCSCMMYCSRECQRQDWLNGHSLTCGMTYTKEIVGRFQGLVKPTAVPASERAARKLKELQLNMSMIQLKLLLDHSETILSQAKELNIPLCDCVVRFDLCILPPFVSVKKYTDQFDAETSKCFEKTRSNENITCIYISRAYMDEEVDDEAEDENKSEAYTKSEAYHDREVGYSTNFVTQRLFPHERLTKKKKKKRKKRNK